MDAQTIVIGSLVGSLIYMAVYKFSTYNRRATEPEEIVARIAFLVALVSISIILTFVINALQAI